MEIEYTCEFVVLAETCNYMEAADRLFVSQSALSRHIKTLEEELKVQLFDRSTRKVSLSPFGSLFLPYARQIASTRYAYEAAIAGALKAEHGNIRLGTIPVMSQYGITDLIMRFRQENPGFSMDIIEGDTLDVTSNSETGDVEEKLPVTTEGKDLTIAFNVRYITDVLKALSDDEVFMRFNSNVSPCVVCPTTGDAYLYLVLPVRVFGA